MKPRIPVGPTLAPHRACAQAYPGRSHALLQEAGINLVAVMREEGFYVTSRNMSAPGGARRRASFGEAAPIELPTPRELALTADRCGPRGPDALAPGTGAFRL